MASTSGSTNVGVKLKHQNFPTYQSHLSPSSSSSSLSTSDFEYDVFLSFRGDTRKSFTDHLYTDLNRNGIVTFRDDQELVRGNEISPKLLQAIQNSRFSIIVLSKTFASSRWCLDELVHILECMKPRNSIIPVFFDVHPSTVRYQTGSYAEAFDEHEETYKHQVEKVNRWRLALTAVSNLSGWHLNDRGEAEFIQSIVKDMTRKLDDTSNILDELDNTSELLNKLKGTYEGFCGENQFLGTDSYMVQLHHGSKYDVFLSFKGDDTVRRFTNSLIIALNHMGFSTFKDDDEDEELHVSSELQKAMQDSSICIIILSTNYAASSWCLEELVQLVECRKIRTKVLPIFYNVAPFMVRHQTFSYAKAFARHEQVFKDRIGRVKRWRSALYEVANLSGWDLNNGPQQEFIPDIVREVSHTLSFLVGIDSRVKKLILYLHLDSDDARIIGICGMAGIGKTTIAKVMYKNISCRFEVCCFLAHVRQDSQRLGLIALQQQLLGRVEMPKNILIRDLQHGISLIRQQLCYKRVLLVLDDVNKSDQLEALAGEAHWFGSGSRIIITTRDEHLLVPERVDGFFESERLKYEEAIQLFSITAFGKHCPVKGYEMLCDHVVEYANGNPLTLRDIGCFLFGRNINEWIYSLNNLKYIPEGQIFEALYISLTIHLMKNLKLSCYILHAFLVGRKLIVL